MWNEKAPINLLVMYEACLLRQPLLSLFNTHKHVELTFDEIWFCLHLFQLGGRRQNWSEFVVFLEPVYTPGLLGCCDGPLVAALVGSGVVGTLEWVQVADDGIRDHDEKGQQPCRSNHSVGMGPRLPHPWLQGVTDGAVSLNRYGNQAKCGDAHWYACRKKT